MKKLSFVVVLIVILFAHRFSVVPKVRAENGINGWGGGFRLEQDGTWKGYSPPARPLGLAEDRTVYAGGGDVLWRSKTNGGGSSYNKDDWEKITTGIERNYTGGMNRKLYAFGVNPVNSDRFMFATNLAIRTSDKGLLPSLELYYSINGGKTFRRGLIKGVGGSINWAYIDNIDIIDTSTADKIDETVWMAGENIEAVYRGNGIYDAGALVGRGRSVGKYPKNVPFNLVYEVTPKNITNQSRVIVDGVTSQSAWLSVGGSSNPNNNKRTSVIFKTVDGGATWTDATGNLKDIFPVTPSCDGSIIGDIKAINDSSAWVTGGVYADCNDPIGSSTGIIAKTTDSGATWSIVSPDQVGVHKGEYVVTINTTDGRVFWASSTKGRMYQSTDGGATFTLSNSEINGGYNQILLALDRPIAANASPTVNITTPTDNQQFPAPADIQITGEAKAAAGTIKHLSITVKDSAGQQRFNKEISRDPGSATETFDTNDPPLTAWKNVAAGTYTITVIATDSAGATAQDSVTITVGSPPESQFKVVDSPTPFASFDYIGSTIDGTSYPLSDPTVSPWNFVFTPEQSAKLKNGEEIAIDLEVRFNGNGCERGGNFSLNNSASLQENDVPSATASPAPLTAECPKLKVVGDVGSTTGSVSNSSKIQVNGPALVVAKTTIDSNFDGSAIIKLPGYTFSSQIKEPMNKLIAKLWGEAKDWSEVVGDLNKNNKPGGGVWKKSGGITLNQNYTGRGTIITDGNVDINGDFTGSPLGSMGIIANGAASQVIIHSLSASKEIKNVIIYVPNGTVKFDNIGTAFTFDGMIVAKDIVVSNSVTESGNINWSAQAAQNPPPGFTDIMDTSELTEKPPQ